jgi:hypothetical protein
MAFPIGCGAWINFEFSGDKEKREERNQRNSLVKRETGKNVANCVI